MHKLEEKKYIKLYSCEEREALNDSWKLSTKRGVEKTLGNIFMQNDYLQSLSLQPQIYALSLSLAFKANDLFWLPFITTREELRNSINFSTSMKSFSDYLNDLEGLGLIERFGKVPSPIKYFVVPYVTEELYEKINRGDTIISDKKQI